MVRGRGRQPLGEPSRVWEQVGAGSGRVGARRCGQLPGMQGRCDLGWWSREPGEPGRPSLSRPSLPSRPTVPEVLSVLGASEL